MVFLIDGSKSVRPENFELVKKWINQIVDKLDVSESKAHVGLVQYSSSVRQVRVWHLVLPNNQHLSPLYKRHVSISLLKEFPLGQYNNKKDLKDAVKKMAYMERGTMTGQALRYLTDSSFSAGQGARPGVAKVGIVFTDGRSQDYIGDAAKKAKEHGKRERMDYFLMHGCSLIRYNTKPTFTSQMRKTCVCLCYRFQDVRCWSGQRSGG